jgi:ankyrin repeat protein
MESPPRESPPRESPARKSPDMESPDMDLQAMESPARESPARESPARDVLPVKFFLPNLKEAKESLDREKGSRESPGREARGTPPEGESSGGSGRTTPRRPVSFDDLGKLSQPNLALVRKKIRHFSGKKFDQVPTLVPLTEEIFMVYMDYLIQNKFNASDIAQTLAALPTDSVLEDCPEGRTVLHVASEHGVPALVEALLQAGHSPLCRTGKGYTPLHLAIFKDNMSVVKKLLAPKEDGVNEKTGQGMTPLHVAVMVRNYDAIRMIRSKKSSDFGLADNKGETALHLAANILTKASQAIMEEDILNEDHVDMIEGVESIINYLLDWIKKDELLRCLQLDKNKQSPLHTLAQLECFSIIRKISDKFDAELLAEFELRNAEGVTPFLICVGKMFMGDKLHMDHVMMMMDIEESVKQQQSRGGRKLRRQQSVPDSPLGCALTLLKRMGNDTMDLTHPSVHNLTALQILIKNVGKKFCSSDDERALVEMMLMKGANVLTTHAGEEAPINLVMSHNFDEKIFVLFIKHLTTETMNHQPSTINWKDEQGETVLHWAVSQMDEKRMEVILELGADIMVRAQTRDQDIEITLPGMQANGKLHRRTPLMVALKNDSCKSMDFLMTHLKYLYFRSALLSSNLQRGDGEGGWEREDR